MYEGLFMPLMMNYRADQTLLSNQVVPVHIEDVLHLPRGLRSQLPRLGAGIGKDQRNEI